MLVVVNEANTIFPSFLWARELKSVLYALIEIKIRYAHPITAQIATVIWIIRKTTKKLYDTSVYWT